MIPLLSAAQMRQADEETIRRIGIPQLVLMERAALAIAEEIISYLSGRYGEEEAKNVKILCVCGGGNNGGDGAACARILSRRGFRAYIVKAFSGHVSDALKEELAIAERMRVPYADEKDFSDAGVIVDALFGTGLSRAVTGPYKEYIEKINASEAYRVSADIPSGIGSDSGQVLGCAVKADLTVTMQFPKAGLFLYPGASYAGKIKAAEVGIADPEEPACMYVIEKKDVRRAIPARDPAGHKGTFGKVLLFAGSQGMAGSALLCAKAVLRAGAGMVRIITHASNADAYLTCLPEAMVSGYDSAEEAVSLLGKFTPWADVIAAGPGIGTGKAAEEAVMFLLRENGKPLILDADAVNVLAGKQDLLSLHHDTVITPHLAEMCRLDGVTPDLVREDRIAYAAEFSGKYGTALILKDARTVTACGGRVYLNVFGNCGMATAGSGDVLTGILAALRARGCAKEDAPWAAAALHAMSGDIAKEKYGESAMTAGDIADALSEAQRSIER